MALSLMKGTFAFKRATQTAGTAITQLIQPQMRGSRTRLTQLSYLCGATIHTLTCLKPLAKTTVATAANASATSLIVTSAAFRGDTIAANDYIIVQHTDKSFGAYLVSAVATVTTLTIPALSAAAAAGCSVWILGATGEAEHAQFKPLASTLSRFQDSIGGLCASGYLTVSSGTTYKRSGNDDPLLVHSDNATNAGVFESISGYYGTL